MAKFIKELTVCSDAKCRLNALRVLQNLPVAEALDYARQFVCSSTASSEERKAALRVVALVPPRHSDSQMNAALLRVFHGACPQPTSTSESQLAVDALAAAVPQHPNVGTYLLRSEMLFPKDHEKWAYLYKAIRTSSQDRDEVPLLPL